MNRSRVRRMHRDTVADSHCGRLLVIESLETRLCMDATADVATSGTEFEVSDQRHLSSPAIVEFHMQLLDLQRKQVESVHVDDQLLLRIFVRDLRESMHSKHRFFSAYTAVSLDENQFQIVGPGKSGVDFWEDLDQLQEKVGGLVVSQYPDGDGHLVFELPIRAIAEGEATIQPEPLQGSEAELFPVTLYGTNDPIDYTQISYKSLPVAVLPKLEARSNEVDAPKLPATTPSPAIEALPILETPVTQPLVTDRPVNTPAAAQLETSIVTNLNQESDVDSTVTTVLLATFMEDLQKADQDEDPALSALYSRDNLSSSRNELLYREAAGIDWTVDSVDSIRFEDARANFFPETDDARQDSSLLDLTGLSKVPFRGASAALSNRTASQPISSQFLGRQPGQQIAQRMLQRIGAFSIDDNSGFQWDVSYMRIPMTQLKLMQSPYVRNQHSTSSFPFEEIVIPRIIPAGAELQQSSQTIPATETISYNRTTEDWSLYQRTAMKPMSLTEAQIRNLEVEDNLAEANSSTGAEGKLEDEAVSPRRSTILWWIIGVVSSVAWGVRVGDRRRSAQIDRKIRGNQTSNL